MSVDQLKDLIQETVKEVLVEMLRDPDGGLELREDFKIVLQRSLETYESESDTVPADEVAEKLGLRW